MKLEIRETVNDLKHGSYFEVWKDEERIKGFFYGKESGLVNTKREDALKEAEELFEAIKTNECYTTVIKSEEI